MEYPKLYKRTSTGKIQVWWMESAILGAGSAYRTHSGQHEGSIVSSEWTVVEGKNKGRANATTSEEQCVKEIEAQYEKKVNQGKYHNDIRAVDSSAKFFSPMLAKVFDADRIEDAFYIQPKLNGVRCIARASGLWSRNGKEFVNTPHISEELEEFFADNPDAILDGELYNHEYKAKFQSLMSAIRKQKPTPASIEESAKVVEYHIYDFPSAPGRFEDRWKALEALFNGSKLEEGKVIRLCPTWRSRDVKTAHGIHDRNKKAGYEGSIIRLNEPYENKRTYSLMKYKDFLDAEFEILDVLEGKGNWSGHAKMVECKLPDGRTFKAGVKGDKAFAKEMLIKKAEYIGKLATIVFQEYSEYGVPIFPIFHSVRDYE